MTAFFHSHPVITSSRSPVGLGLAVALSAACVVVTPVVKDAISVPGSREAHSIAPIHLTGSGEAAGIDHSLSAAAVDLTADAATIEHYRRSSAPISLW